MNEENEEKEEDIKDKDPHLINLVDKIVKDFGQTIAKESDPSNILLKGQLFVENLADELLVIFDINPNRKTFSKKIECLNGIKAGEYLDKKIKRIVRSLYAINEVRNNLAHNLNFKPDESSVNRIGITLGREFILKKYEVGYEEVSINLIFCLQRVSSELGSSIYIKAKEIKREEESKETQD